MNKNFCPNCGAELSRDDIFCGSCGTRIGESELKKAADEKYPHLLATILGYIFAFLSGLLGILFGIYLWTREHPRAKFHGKLILIITVCMILFWSFILIIFS